MMQIAVIIPALNEAGNIASLVADTRAVLAAGEIIVVDNGSGDQTASVARTAGAKVILEPQRGYGYACAAGVEAAREADVLVFLDGDHSSRPAEMPRLLQPILDGKADLVLGSRFMGRIAPGAMPLHQRWGNWLLARMVRHIYRIPVTDLGPYRAIRRDVLNGLAMQEMTFGWPSEMMVKAARQHIRLVEVPVSFMPRREGHSKVSGTLMGTILAAWYILKVILGYARPLREG